MSTAARLFLIPLAALAGLAHGIGLGEVSEQSAFGTSLRVVVPVLAGAGEDLAGECVKLVSARQSDDGIPEVRNARAALERTAAGARIVVMSPRPVTDPVLKLTLQVGCDSAVRREYLLLLDPPPIDVPVVAQDSSSQRGAAATPVPETARPTCRRRSFGRRRGRHRGGARASRGRAPPGRHHGRRRRAPAHLPRDKTAPKSGAATVRAAPKAAIGAGRTPETHGVDRGTGGRGRGAGQRRGGPAGAAAGRRGACRFAAGKLVRGAGCGSGGIAAAGRRTDRDGRSDAAGNARDRSAAGGPERADRGGERGQDDARRQPLAAGGTTTGGSWSASSWWRR